jgi:hypothetical protein
VIELDITAKKDGTHGRVLGLKTARVTITPHGTNRVRVTTVRTHAGQLLNGSTRHNDFDCWHGAEAYALRYANAVAKQKREKEA